MCINSNSDHHLDDQYGLDRSTFKFMIDSDDTIKVTISNIQNLLKICRRRIFPKHIQTVEHIKELTQMIAKTDVENFYVEEE